MDSVEVIQSISGLSSSAACYRSHTASSATCFGISDDDSDDLCSICLESFTIQDPATVTKCRHEYHLQCILEWSQRSKECPICWQLLVLKDPSSQELLAAVEVERNLRSRRTPPSVSASLYSSYEEVADYNGAPHAIDTYFAEQIMQHLAAASASRRTRSVSREEREASTGFGPSQALDFDPHANDPDVQQTQTVSSELQNSVDSFSDSGLPTFLQFSINRQASPIVATSAVNMVSSAGGISDDHLRPRVHSASPPHDSPRSRNHSEFISFSESLKSKVSAASSRYKESISKSTRGIKDKLLARNNSVKEMSRGVQREVSAGVARMMECIGPNPKQRGVSVPFSNCNRGTSLFSFRKKSGQENVISQALSTNTNGTDHDLSFDTSSYVATNNPSRSTQAQAV